MPDKETLDRFGDAVEERKQQAKDASAREAPGAGEPEHSLPPEQSARVDRAHEQDDRDARTKGTGHKQKTADKWNQ